MDLRAVVCSWQDTVSLTWVLAAVEGEEVGEAWEVLDNLYTHPPASTDDCQLVSMMSMC